MSGVQIEQTISVQTIKDYFSMKKKKWGFLALMVFIGICASGLMYWITGQGPGVSPDSTVYIEAARSFIAGNGFFVQGQAMTSYPPVYPLLLTLIALVTHGDILASARLLCMFFFGVNLILLTVAVNICTKHNLTATACAMLIFLASAPIISVHAMAWSEAPFITFSMACFVLLSGYISSHRKYLLFLASLMAGFAAATRYVGVILFPAIIFTFILLDSRSVRHRIKDMAVFLMIAILPLASWIIRNMLLAGSTTNRRITFHPLIWERAKTLIINTMHDYILPLPFPSRIKEINFWIVMAFFIVWVVIICRKILKKQIASSTDITLPLFCLIYSLMYIIFLIVSISFFDAHTPLDYRILLPAFLALTAAGIIIAWSLSEEQNRRWIRHVFIFLLLASSCINAIPAVVTAVNINKNGSGYTSRYWNDSQTIACLSDFPEVRVIYSNGPDVIRFLTGKEAVMIPEKLSADTLKKNDGYENEMRRMIRKCKEEGALIVYFNEITWRWYLPSVEEIESSGNLPVLKRVGDGVIFGTR